MKLLKKYFFLASIFTIFLLIPFSIQIQENNSHNQTITSIGVSFNFSIANAEIVGSGGFLECESNFLGVPDISCGLVNFLHIIAVNAGNVLVGLAAKFMDFFLSHSLQSSSYRDAGFIEQGWEILRDITNIVFIFALLYIAFNMVLGSGGSDNKKRLIRVILISLTINFSLFMTYAIIDSSNILAHVFYNKIEQQDINFNKADNEIQGEISGKSASLAIANKINPQKLFLNDVGKEISKGQRMIMVVMAGIINGTLIYVFLSVSFLFLGRTIGLWLAAILAPLAFASLTVPKMENLDYIGFGKWFSSLLQMAFMAPIFIFILYLAVQFMNVGIIAETGSGDFLDNILTIIIPMAAIVVLLLLAKKVANKMSGDFAGVISGVVAKVAGGALALGAIATTGGASLAAGGLGKIGTSAVGKKMGLEGAGKGLRKFSRAAASTKIDVSKLPGFKTAFGKDATALTGKISGRSILGHKAGAQTYLQKSRDDVFEVETDKIGKENLDTVKAAAKRRTDKAKSAEDWQKDVKNLTIDEKSAADIKKEEKTLMKDPSRSTDPRSKDSSGGPLTNKEFIQALHDEFSKGLVLQLGDNGEPEEKKYGEHVNGGETLYMTKNGNEDGSPISRIEFENNQTKIYEKEVKKAERSLKNAQATGEHIEAATDWVREKEKQLEEFKKRTAKEGKETAEKIQSNVRGQARETVAKKHIDSSNKTGISASKKEFFEGAAKRTRSGKVKVDDESNPGVKEKKK